MEVGRLVFRCKQSGGYLIEESVHNLSTCATG